MFFSSKDVALQVPQPQRTNQPARMKIFAEHFSDMLLSWCLKVIFDVVSLADGTALTNITK